MFFGEPAFEEGAQYSPRLLGGSWVVISGFISKATIVITHSRGFLARDLHKGGSLSFQP